MTLSLRILGCGSSGGVPRLGGHWGACDPTNPKNIRKRCSMLVTRTSPTGVTRVLIDTSPDLRQQLLDARMVVYNMRQRLQVWADGDTGNQLLARFGYAFVQPKGSSYPPICDLNTIDGDVTIDGAGGPITLTPFEVEHGSIDALGFRINNAAYLPDVSDIPDDVWPHLQNLDLWIVDALRRDPHPTHAHLEKTLEWIDRVKPKHAVLTNMHIDLDYQTLADETPEHIEPAFDGLTLTIED